jgi:hypothetical protein
MLKIVIVDLRNNKREEVQDALSAFDELGIRSIDNPGYGFEIFVDDKLVYSDVEKKLAAFNT